MKNILILFFLIPTILVSQKTKSIAGTYKFGNDIHKENIGELLVMPESDSTVSIYMKVSKKAPFYNTSVLLTELEIIDKKTYYQPKTGDARVCFEFFNNSVNVTDLNEIVSTHIFLENQIFRKVAPNIPKTFIRGNGKVVQINKSAAEYQPNYYPNNTLWDFIGIWRFGQGAEALNISKDLLTNSINVQYNSSSDGFEDRYIENCQWRKGKIYGDYYGGKENVIIEMEDGNLLLTINPFHQFQSLEKQVFKKYPKSIFKYCSQEENAYLYNGSQIVDSLPPGDRVLLLCDQKNLNFNPIISYVSRFNTSHVNKNNMYVKQNQLSDTKPLFVSDAVELKFFPNLNKSELFVKQLYTPEKLKENIEIVRVPEQNVVGQKKLLVDKDVYAKLSLATINRNYDNINIYVTGTIDLSKEFNTLVIDFQSDNEYYAYLVNYTIEGKYIDHILIGRDDYVESFTPIKSIFAAGEVYVNSMIFTEDDSEKSSYKIFKTERYTLNRRGQFIASGYSNSFMHQPEVSLKIVAQQVKSKRYGNVLINLFLNYIDTSNVGGYAISMSAEIETEAGIIQNIPIELQQNNGFIYPPYGSFVGPSGMLQKIFNTNINEGAPASLAVKLHFNDVTNDDVEELFLEITDNSYTIPPKSYFCFLNDGGTWVYSEYNEKANEFINDVGMPYEMVFKSYYKFGFPPYSLEVDDDKKSTFLLSENEQLIYTFKVKDSDKRVSIGVTENCKYVVYRFGKEGSIEFEYKAEYNSNVEKFNYFKNDQTLIPPRNYLENISFTNEDYQYVIYDNYLETDLMKYDSIFKSNPTKEYSVVLEELYDAGVISNAESIDIQDYFEFFKITPGISFKPGIGIMVRNLKTNKISFIEADESSTKGYMELIKACIWKN